MTRAPDTGVIPQWSIADRLRKAREYAGLEQGELAEAIDLSRTTVSNYETARVAPRRSSVRQWALRCGVSFEWLWSAGEPDDGGLVRREGIEPPTRWLRPAPVVRQLAAA